MMDHAEHTSKPRPIVMTIFPDPEAWLREHLRYLESDGVCCVYPIRRDADGVPTRYIDEEYDDENESHPDKERDRDMADHIRALQLLCEQIGRTLFVGGLKSPFDLLDAGNWDAEVVDAYWQLVYRREVIYG
jgi:hypothetical protein